MISGIMKFVVFIPVGFVGIQGVTLLNLIKRHPDLQPPYFDQKTYTGATMIAVVGMFMYIWTFLSWIPSWSPPDSGISIFINSVDVVLSTLLLVAVGFQSTYIPATRPSCNNAYTWQGRPYNESYFALLARYNLLTKESGEKYYLTARGQCLNLQGAWWCAIVAGALTFLVALLTLVMAFSDRTSKAAAPAPRQRRNANRRNVFSLASMPLAAIVAIGRYTRSAAVEVSNWYTSKQTERRRRRAAAKDEANNLELGDTSSMLSETPSVRKNRLNGISTRPGEQGSPSAPLGWDRPPSDPDSPPVYQELLADNERRV